MNDLKEALSNTRKPDTTHVRSGIRRYIARACEYGSAKYERANFLRPAGEFGTLGDDFVRFRSYLRAAQDHIADVLDKMEQHQTVDPQLVNDDGLKRAAYAADTDQSKPDFPASGLPHVAHAAASLMMAIEQAVEYGLLPADPGQPWRSETPARPPCEYCEAGPSVGRFVWHRRYSSVHRDLCQVCANGPWEPAGE